MKAYERGFTLIELIVVIGVLLLLAGAAAPIYGNFQVRTQIREATTTVVTSLRNARERSVARIDDSTYGVYFASGSSEVVLFKGDSYAGRDQNYDEIYPITSSLTMSSTFTADAITFTKGLGIASEGGGVVISSSAESSTVSVNDKGVVSY
ncbi:prepilin-type N-terminal cleavage/methylation domain-containing protein [candidate division WWE3 bacterium]|uniref:Prepilin-type N-terminal cleavage/methylation domain-containing protein n=1 Tax=candidate division WWE3 bacterium TaxID=2053526 RepID=A0A955LJV0_UNCKA|nr:prepilin-type N-terminal cleavage/methylation domain-containing protein [candidate division WWE3 bacterium]